MHVQTQFHLFPELYKSPEQYQADQSHLVCLAFNQINREVYMSMTQKANTVYKKIQLEKRPEKH